jgi:RHS repeat-associated protein
MIASLLSGFSPAPAVAAVHAAPPVQKTRSVTGLVPVPHRPAPNRDQTRGREYKPTETRLPGAAAGGIALAAPAARQRYGAMATATGSPVFAQAVAPATGAYRGPSRIGVRVAAQSAAQKLGIRGVVWQMSGLAAGAGDVRAGLSYKDFAQAYGGNYGLRLTLVQLPACSLTTPQLASCRTQTPLATVNDAKTATLSTVVPLASTSAAPAAPSPAARTGVRQVAVAGGAVVLAATTTAGGEGGAAGTYGATSLKPSGSWTGGGSSGSFDYTYPVALPGASSPLVPSADLSYDSGSVDGQTAATQAQANWAGDGWSTSDSYVERSFLSCSDGPEGKTLPTADQTEDMCYDGNILTVSLNGSTTSIVYDDTSKTYRLQDDDGATVQLVTGTSYGTTPSTAGYWVITERDGAQYWFGRNELPGWATGDKTTNSVDYEPVYGANSGDPCYNSAGFTKSVCNTAYRWRLDYVTDVHGDAMSYYYTQATNYYGEDNGATVVPYIRDSYLTEVDYGFRAGSAYSTTAVPDKVLYGTGVRCFASSCPAITTSNSGTATSDYPDVPYDLNCASGSACKTYGPTFWSTVRLTTITTEQYNGSAWNGVDLYTLNESEPATGDGTSPTLWLSSISHKGEDTTAGGSTSGITLPSVTFGGQDLANRVDTTNFPGLYRWRIDEITTEMGGSIGVTYSTPYTCSASYVDGMTTSASAASNTESCYPVWWTPANYTAPVMDWFEKYAVSEVTVTDTTGGALQQQTDYQYSGGAAWHYDDNEVTKAKYRTYGQFRGYGTVTTRTGDPANNPQTESVITYYRGMSDDNNTTAVTLTDSQGGTHGDANQLAGQTLETTTYNGDGGPIDTSTITSYWVSAATASRARTGLPALTANMVEPAETWTRTADTDGGTTTWQVSESDTTYDATTTDANFGLPLYAYSHTVPVKSAYDQCTSTTYALANTSENLVGLVASTETDSVACAGFTEGSTASVPSGLNTLTGPVSTIVRPDDVVSATENFYDDATTWSTTFPQATAPTAGNLTMTRNAAGYSGTTAAWPSWQTTARHAYDSYGRVLNSYDGNGKDTTTAYTVSAAGLTTALKFTNPLSQSASQTLDPERGLTLTASDVNGIVTTLQYDALGRRTSVWLDSRATTAEANDTYAYTESGTGISGIVAKQMGEQGGYATTVTILDSLGRTRETQTDTAEGGRLITDDFYDSHGWAWKENVRYWDSSATPTLAAPYNPADNQVPDQQRYTFNGTGQVVQDASYKNANLVSTETTVYNGDRTTVIPAQGGTVTATVTDPLGRATETDEYPVAPTLVTPSNTFTGTWYLTGGTVSAAKTSYDNHGNQDALTDAGSHQWTKSFNLLGQVTSTTAPDSGSTTGMTYDGDGNLLQQTTAEGTVSYAYDTTSRKTAEYAAPTSGQAAYSSTTSPGNELASWVYDNSNSAVARMKDPLGHLTTETTYSGGYPYVIQQAGFNVFGDSNGETYTIPSTGSDAGLSGSYSFIHYWTVNTGLDDGTDYAAAGSLPEESTTPTYLASPLDLISGLGGTLTGYAQSTSYDPYGDVLQEEIGTGTNLADITSTYDPHTLDLTDQLVTRKVATPSYVDEESYAYNPNGNITSQTSTRLGNPADSETQCYQYDGLDQLTQAWTATNNCATTPTTGNTSMVGDGISSSSAYWTTWNFDTSGGNAPADALGTITSQVQHSLTGGADTTTTNSYGVGSGGPHAMTGAATTGGSTASSSFTYDAAGNMSARVTPSNGSQTLHWNAAGQLTSVTSSANTSSYVYDPDGNLLLQVDPANATLYLDGEQVSAPTAGSPVTGTRIIALPGGGDVVRTGAGSSYSFEVPDPHGTNDLYLDSTAQSPTWRQFTPYGAPRGAGVTWVDNREFLNKPTDTATGLTYIGPRAYDPVTGQFTSPDPVFEASNPQDWNPYLYAFGNPVDFDDPTGLWPSWGDVTNFLDTAAPIADVVAAATVEIPGVDVVTAGAAAAINGADCAANVIGAGIDAYHGNYAGAAVDLAGAIPGLGETKLGKRAIEMGGELAKTGIARFGKAVENSCGLSFTPDTRVLLASGKSVPISALKPGMKVLAVDTRTGKNQPETVADVQVNHDHDLYDLKVTTARGVQVIHTTSNHPFWDVTLHKWVAAGQLRKGDRLRSANGATVTADGGTTPRQQAAWMWDLTVPGNNDHDFYVLLSPSYDLPGGPSHAGTGTFVLVHNNDRICARGAAIADRMIRGARDGDAFPKAPTYHGDTKHAMSDDRVLEMIQNPDGVYVSSGNTPTITFHKDGDIALAYATGANKGRVFNAYGSSGVQDAWAGDMSPGEPETVEGITTGRRPATPVDVPVLSGKIRQLEEDGF